MLFSFRFFNREKHLSNRHAVHSDHCFRISSLCGFSSAIRLAFLAGLILLLAALLSHFSRPRQDQDSFRTLTQQLFVSEMTSNTLNMHYTLAHPEHFGIRDYQVLLPGYSSQAHLTALAQTENLIHVLSSFDENQLTKQDASFRSLLLRSLENALYLSAYPYYEEPLSPSSGMQSQLPILLAEYTFRSVRDVEDYLKLLAQTDDYFASLLVFEQEKANRGLQMSASSLDKVIRQCDTILTKEELLSETHFLQITFRERLQPLTKQQLLSDEEAAQYINQNHQLLLQVMLPAYQALGDGLTVLKDPSVTAAGLAARPEGAAYYQHLIYAQCGSSKSVSQIKSMLFEQFQAEAENIKALLIHSPSLTADSCQAALERNFPLKNASAMLEDLQERMAIDFPDFIRSASAPATLVKTVSDSLQDYCAPAFYLTPPLDDVSLSAIYINEKSTPAGLELYTTLAHEGYPGHMFQTVYHNLSVMKDGADLSHAAQELLWYGGYLEGWALYVELIAYDHAAKLLATSGSGQGALLSDAALLAKHDRSLLLCLYSLLDIMIHYENASLEEITDFLHPFGITDLSSVTAIYEYIAEEPTNYLKYYLGYLEILSLKEQARTLWGEAYSDLEFHTFFLESGPADFDMLAEKLRDWEIPQPRS